MSKALFVNIGEVLADFVRGFVTDIKQDMVATQTFHFEIDGSGNDISGGKLAAVVKFLHEGGAVGEKQASTFAP